MNTPTETPASPSLEHLPYETRVRIEVAETQGWTGVGMRRMRHKSSLTLEGFPPYRIGAARSYVPDYLHDPAAWGALMERERIALVPSEDGWYAVAPEDVEHGSVRGTDVRTITVHWPEHAERAPADSPGEAVAAAVLAKYGREVKP